MNVCVFGASSRSLDEIYYIDAAEMGRLLAEGGDTIVYGGGAEGLMGACAKAAVQAGGEVIGIAPKFFDEPGILYDKCRMMFTDTMRERKQLMQDNSSACVVLPGGIGTLEEFFEMLTLKQLGQDDRAMIILNTAGCYDEMLAMLKEMAARRFMADDCLELYTVASTPHEAMEQLKSYTPKSGSIHRLEDYSK